MPAVLSPCAFLGAPVGAIGVAPGGPPFWPLRSLPLTTVEAAIRQARQVNIDQQAEKLAARLYDLEQQRNHYQKRLDVAQRHEERCRRIVEALPMLTLQTT